MTIQDPVDLDEPTPDLTDTQLEAINTRETRHTIHTTTSGQPHSPGAELLLIAQAIDPWMITANTPAHLTNHPPEHLFYDPINQTIARTITQAQALAEPNPRDTQHIISRTRTHSGDDTADLVQQRLEHALNRNHTATEYRHATIDLHHLLNLHHRRTAAHLLHDLTQGTATLDITLGTLTRLTDTTTRTGLHQVDITEIAHNPPTPQRPNILQLTDDTALFYAGKVNAIISPPGIGKSWLAVAACAEQINNGAHTVYVDLEDDAATIVTRLIGLGVTPDNAIARFHYLNHDGAWTATDTARLVNIVAHQTASIVIIDGGAEALARADIDENSNSEVLGWFTAVPRPCADAGACVIVLEHDPKNAQNKGWGRGAGAKRAALSGASYLLEADVELTHTSDGVWTLTLGKDRPGGTDRKPGSVVARVVAKTGFEGRVSGIRIARPATDSDGQVGPSDSLSVVMRVLLDQPGRRFQGKRNLRSAVNAASKLGTTKTDQAVDVLTRKGAIRITKQGGSKPDLIDAVAEYDALTDTVTPFETEMF